MSETWQQKGTYDSGVHPVRIKPIGGICDVWPKKVENDKKEGNIFDILKQDKLKHQKCQKTHRPTKTRENNTMEKENQLRTSFFQQKIKGKSTSHQNKKYIWNRKGNETQIQNRRKGNKDRKVRRKWEILDKK